MPYVEKLKIIKEDKKMTNKQISELGNIGLSTVIKVFNGDTENPTFETIDRITNALGVSLDELAGRKTADEPPIASPIVETFNSYSELLKEKDDRIQELKADKQQLIADKETIRKKNNQLLIALVCSITTLLVGLGVLLTIITMTH